MQYGLFIPCRAIAGFLMPLQMSVRRHDAAHNLFTLTGLALVAVPRHMDTGSQSSFRPARSPRSG